MPQASEALRAKFPDGCQTAYDVLRPFCLIERGVVRPRYKTTIGQLTDREWDAIDYLVAEWDFTWDNWSAEER